MRRLLAIGAATALAFSAAPALAGTSTYSGQLDAEYEGAVEFRVKKRNGVRKVKAVTVEDVVIACGNDKSYLTGFEMQGSAKVKHGAFNMKGGDAYYTVRFEGTLSGPAASGTARYSGFTNTPDAGTQGCDSGPVAWTASR